MKQQTSQLSLNLLQADNNGPRRTTSQRSSRPALPRLAIGPVEAAEMLGVSRDFFDEHVKPELRIVRRGSKMILIPVAELQRWLEKSAARCGR